jgi:hypothetical protein
MEENAKKEQSGFRQVRDSVQSVNPAAERSAYFILDVDEVDSPGRVEFNQFVPSLLELHILATFWMRVCFEIDIKCVLEGQVASSDWRTQAYAEMRLDRIEEVTQGGPVGEALDFVFEEMRAAMGNRQWSKYQRKREELLENVLGRSNIRQPDEVEA